MDTNLKDGGVSVPPDKIPPVLEACRLIRESRQLSARTLASVAGKIMAIRRAFAPAKVSTLELYQMIDTWNRPKWSWNERVLITQAAKDDAQWVLENFQRFNGRPAWKPSRLKVLYVDASTTGWGAQHEGEEAVGHWDYPIQPGQITWAEAEATLLGLESFKNVLQGNYVSIRIDNVGAQVTIFKGGRQPWQKQILRRLHTFCLENDIWIFNAEHIPTDQNPADSPSRRVDLDDWSIRREMFLELDADWGPHTIDRLADLRNAQTSLFNSRWRCPGTEAVDCFTEDWKGDNNWAVPPFALIP